MQEEEDGGKVIGIVMIMTMKEKRSRGQKMSTTVFNVVGGNVYIVPAGTIALRVDVQGAQGGNGFLSPQGTGGLGGRVQALICGVVPGDLYQVVVAGQGGAGAGTGSAPGGTGFRPGGDGGMVISGPNAGGGGGGSSSFGGPAGALVAGGGGGGGGSSTNNGVIGTGAPGGAGGSPTGNGGTSLLPRSGQGGLGGDQGGTGGAGGVAVIPGDSGDPGTLAGGGGNGGDAVIPPVGVLVFGGSGGGGGGGSALVGLGGGGGGGSGGIDPVNGGGESGGGGGGSSSAIFLNAQSNSVQTSGVRQGNGIVIVTAITQVVTPVLTTQVSAPTVRLGTPVTDVATISGGDNPVGTLSFFVSFPTDPTCTASVLVGSVPVNGNGTYTSPPFTPPPGSPPGVYRFQAQFVSNDCINQDVTTACNDPNEQVLMDSAAALFRILPLTLSQVTSSNANQCARRSTKRHTNHSLS